MQALHKPRSQFLSKEVIAHNVSLARLRDQVLSCATIFALIVDTDCDFVVTLLGHHLVIGMVCPTELLMSLAVRPTCRRQLKGLRVQVLLVLQ